MLRLLSAIVLLLALVWLVKRLASANAGRKPVTGTIATPSSRADALAILGLGEDASRNEIIAAHRQLMQKLHPDRGGNDYLAAQINRAKEILLG